MLHWHMSQCQLHDSRHAKTSMIAEFKERILRDKLAISPRFEIEIKAGVYRVPCRNEQEG